MTQKLKTTQIIFKLTPVEKEKILRQAKILNMSLAAYCRTLLLNTKLEIDPQPIITKS